MIFLHEKSASHSRMVKLARWAKKHKNFNIRCEVVETTGSPTKYEVKIYGDRVRTDRFGNRYVPMKV